MIRPKANPEYKSENTEIVRPKANPVVPTSILTENPSSDTIPIRAYLNSAGLDNDKITYKDGNVYYGGRSITPTENRDGVTYAGKKDLDAFIGGVMNDNGYLGIRDTFKKQGLDTSKLGYGNGVVTYNGVSYTPPINANGTTYGDKNGVIDFVGRAGASENNPYVRINTYKNGYGIDDIAWDAAQKKVLIGGREIPYAYIDDDGNAWALKKNLDNIYAQIAKEYGIKSYSDLQRSFDDSDEQFKKQLEDIKSRQFTFDTSDLDQNAVWKAYAAMYDAAADKAYKDTLAKASARTGGNISTMALIAADEARNRMLEQKMNIIPSIAEMAYKQYSDSVNKDLDVVGKQYNSRMGRLENEAALSQNALSLLNAQKDSQRNRILESREDEQYQSGLDQQAYQMATLFNAPIPKDIAEKYGVSPKADGTYPTPNELDIEKQMQIWNEYEKIVSDYNADRALEDYYKQQDRQLADWKIMQSYK